MKFQIYFSHLYAHENMLFFVKVVIPSGTCSFIQSYAKQGKYVLWSQTVEFEFWFCRLLPV